MITNDSFNSKSNDPLISIGCLGHFNAKLQFRNKHLLHAYNYYVKCQETYESLGETILHTAM